MRAFAGLLSLMCALTLCAACGKNAPTAANGNGGTNAATASSPPGGANGNAPGNTGGGQTLDTSKLDAEIDGLEQEAEKKPEDDTTLDALAEAYVRRAHALYDARRLTDALRDYQSALRYSPDNEEANLRVAQITQEVGAEPHAEDGKPVAVPAKPGANENQ